MVFFSVRSIFIIGALAQLAAFGNIAPYTNAAPLPNAFETSQSVSFIDQGDVVVLLDNSAQGAIELAKRDIIGEIKNPFKKVSNKVKDSIGDAKDKAASAVNKVKDEVVNTSQKAGGAISNITDKAKDKVVEAAVKAPGQLQAAVAANPEKTGELAATALGKTAGLVFNFVPGLGWLSGPASAAITHITKRPLSEAAQRCSKQGAKIKCIKA
ncbi:hypothetical protein BDF19DRAFT_456099 [Syncephalis fuscata]|nr:hypothetical protein BDF19DRAFT_456099 [Syncephalis fuscata]